MIFKIFISHSGDDKIYVDSLVNSLECVVEIEPYVATYYPKPGTSLTQKIVNELKLSNYMVVLLTRKASLSQWVNQEIGYFFAQGKPMIPIVEEKVKVEAFLEGVEHISLAKRYFENTIARTIYSLRNLIPKGHDEGTLHVRVKCLKCDCEYKQPLPLHHEIEERVRKKELFATKCPKCRKENLFHPKTLIQIGYVLCPSCGTRLKPTPRKTWKMAGRPDKSGKRTELTIGLFDCPTCRKPFRVVMGRRKI